MPEATWKKKAEYWEGLARALMDGDFQLRQLEEWEQQGVEAGIVTPGEFTDG